MLKTVLIAASFFIASLTNAQNNQFVEVVVEDTLQIDAEEIIYVVRYEDWSTTVAMDTMPVINTPAQTTVDYLREVRQIVQAMQLDTVKEETYSVSPDRERSLSRILIRFQSMEQLMAFTNRIRPLENIKGAIVQKVSSQEKAAEKVLFQRLLVQAKTKASALAHLAGKKLGTIITIKEKDYQGGWTMYPPLSAMGERYADEQTNQTNRIILYSGLIVQFHWQ